MDEEEIKKLIASSVSEQTSAMQEEVKTLKESVSAKDKEIDALKTKIEQDKLSTRNAILQAKTSMPREQADVNWRKPFELKDLLTN